METDKYLDETLHDEQNDIFDNTSIDETTCPKRNNSDHVIDNNGKKLISMCKATDHIIANGRLHGDKNGNYTFSSQRGLSVTDYLLLNKNDIISLHDFKILEWSPFSDHAAVYFTFNMKCINNENSTSNCLSDQRLIFNEEKVPEFKELLKNTIHSISNENITDKNTVLQVETLTNFLHEKANVIFGKTFKINTNKSDKNSVNQKPKWFNEACFSAKQEFKTSRNNFSHNKTDENRISFTRARTKYNRARKKAKQKFKLKEGQRLENIAKTKPKQFWKSIKKCYNKSKNSKNNVKLDDLYDHFNSLLGQEPENDPADVEIQNNQNDELDCQITEEEVRKAVFKQNNGKASGPDDLSAEIIKASYDIISPQLVSIYNNLFNKSEYPESWGLGFIVPILKGGDPNIAKNYRGITLNNILAKIYSQILLNRLTVWAEKYDKISNCQFGYQKGKCTTDCIFILHSIIAKVLNSGQKLYSIFIDYEKAYDKINHIFLWQKMLSENISSKITNAIKSMYSVVRSVIKHNSKLSNSIHSHLGVKQGDPSSSLLFMMFINDIVTSVRTDIEGLFSIDELKLFLILYADDQILFATSPTSLQSMLNDIEIYCNTWNLKINIAKTKVLIFEKSNRHTNYDFYLYNEKLEVVKSFKYLGVYFFKNGNWSRTQKCIAEHASKAMHRLFSVFNQYEFKTNEKCKLFDTLVSSILSYSSEIWGYHEGKDIEAIHTKFLRKLLCVNKSTNLAGLYGELGRVPMNIMRKIHMIRYWFKLLKSENNSLIKRIYIMLRNDADSNNSYNNLNWAYHIKSMLQTLGLANLWIEQDMLIERGSLDSLFTTIKQRILDQYYQTWYCNINNSQRLITYSRFKHTFNLEQYLDSIHDKKLKIAMSRFRLSSHRLEIERGRYRNIQRSDRKCKFCTQDAIENEYHFLLACPQYLDIRKKYLRRYYWSWPTLNKFDTVMTSTNKNEILNLSKYIYYATKLRNELDT